MKACQRKKRTFCSKRVKRIDLGKRLGTFNKLVFLLNVLVALLLLLTCVVLYITSELFWFLSPFSLIVSYLVLVNIVFLIYWIFNRRIQMVLSLSVLLIAFFTQGTFVKLFNANDSIMEVDISVLTFNSHGARGVRWSRNPLYDKAITDFIALENPDIVCFQEYNSSMDDRLRQYPYNYKTPFYIDKSSQAIYSKYRIIETGSLNFEDSWNNALYADIVIEKDTIRIYNLHLQSLVVRAGSFKREQPQRLYRRLGITIQKQQQQANLVKDHASKVAYRKIICGDFNNTQFSNVYHTIKGDMSDSFQEKGFGLGSTYDFKFLPFRIDFILADPEFEITSHKNFDVRMSDHRPVMASFRLKE